MHKCKQLSPSINHILFVRWANSRWTCLLCRSDQFTNDDGMVAQSVDEYVNNLCFNAIDEMIGVHSIRFIWLLSSADEAEKKAQKTTEFGTTFWLERKHRNDIKNSMRREGQNTIPYNWLCPSFRSGDVVASRISLFFVHTLQVHFRVKLIRRLNAHGRWFLPLTWNDYALAYIHVRLSDIRISIIMCLKMHQQRRMPNNNNILSLDKIMLHDCALVLLLSLFFFYLSMPFGHAHSLHFHFRIIYDNRFIFIPHNSMSLVFSAMPWFDIVEIRQTCKCVVESIPSISSERQTEKL